MTRISVGVKPKELCDKHLNKERIEILRIPNSIKNGKAKINKNNIPKTFRLNTGHVIFFYDKIKYLHKRYNELTNECINRGFNVTDYSDAFNDIPNDLYNDYVESINDRLIVVERIKERLNTMENIKYYKKDIKLNELLLKYE